MPDDSVEGMWTVWFEGVAGLGCGIVVLETQKVFGGDSSWYYRGSYTIDGGQFSAEVEVTHYGARDNAVTGHPPEKSPFQLTLSADRVKSDRITAKATTEHGQMTFELKKVAELPP